MIEKLYTEKQIAIFWGNVNIRFPNDCWEWRISTRNGYGSLQFNKKTRKAHRVAYELTFGKIPEGLCCCHRCDNPLCCNPRHLFLGTIKENMQDRNKKGRQARGEKASKSKLTEKKVLAIRRKYALGGCSHGDLAKEFNIAKSNVTKIINGKNWKHVKDELEKL